MNLKFLLLVGCVLQTSCDRADESSRVGPSLAQSLANISAVAKLANDDSGNWPYFQNAQLRLIYTESGGNLDQIRRILVDDGLSSDIQVLAVRVAQCLDLAAYLKLIEDARAALEAGELRPEVMRALILPGAEWGTALSVAYKDAEVVRVLRVVEQSHASTVEIRESVESVLSGEQASFIEVYNQPGEPLPRLSCKHELERSAR